MPQSKSLFSDSDVKVLAIQVKYLAAKAVAQERKKREKEEAKQKWAEEERKKRKAAEMAVAAEKKKKWEAAETEKAKKVSGLKTAEKWRAIEESDLDNIEIVDEARSKWKRGKINITMKYDSTNLCGRCKYLNIECVAK